MDRSWNEFIERFVNDDFYWFQPKGYSISKRNLPAIQRKLKLLKDFEGVPWREAQRDYTRALERDGLFTPRCSGRSRRDYPAIARMNKQVFDSLGVGWITDESIVQVTGAGNAFLAAQTSDLPNIVDRQLARYLYPNPAVGRPSADAGVFPYLTLLAVLTHFPDGIPLECYSLFIARIRTEDDVAWAVELITRYESLRAVDRRGLIRRLESFPILKHGRLVVGGRRSSILNTIQLDASYMLSYLAVPGLLLCNERCLCLDREKHATAEALVQEHLRCDRYIDFATSEDWIAFYGEPDRRPTYAEALAYYRRRGDTRRTERTFQEARSAGKLPTELEGLTEEQFRRLQVLEKTLEDFLEFNLPVLENGLEFVARQYPTSTGPLDILAKDDHGRWVVVELKRGRAAEKVLGQLLRYRGFIIQERAGGNQERVRGFVVAPDPDGRLIEAARGARPAPVEVFEFEVRGKARRLYPNAEKGD